MTQNLTETDVQPRTPEEATADTLVRPPAEAAARVDATESEARELAEAAREAGWSRPSFARGLYLGRFDLSLIHPHPQGAGEGVDRGEAFLAELRAVCEKLDGQRIEREDRIPDEYVAALADIGTFGIKIPREYGGLGLGMAYYGKALMLVGSVHPSIGALVSAHQSIGVPEPVRMFGTEEQKQRFLPRCAAGAITAFLLTEPDVGSDPARMSSTATPTEDGTAYLLDGVKLWTTNGVIAELVVVMARVPEHAGGRGGISAFVVDTEAEGITVEARNSFMGLSGPGERRDPVPPGARARREPARSRGRRPQDRAHHSQHRPAVHPRVVRICEQVVPQDRAGVVGSSGCSGAAPWGSTGPSRRRSPSSPRPPSASRRYWDSLPSSPTRA